MRFDLRRVYTAVVLAPLIYAVIRYLPPIAFIALLFVVGAIALYELYRLFFQERTNRVLIGIGPSPIYSPVCIGTVPVWSCSSLEPSPP